MKCPTVCPECGASLAPKKRGRPSKAAEMPEEMPEMPDEAPVKKRRYKKRKAGGSGGGPRIPTNPIYGNIRWS